MSSKIVEKKVYYENKNVIRCLEQSSANFNIDSLSDLILLKILKFFNLRELLSVERVCKRWQSIILQILEKEKALSTCWMEEKTYNCLKNCDGHKLKNGDIRDAIVMNNGWFYDFTDKNSLIRLFYIFKRCPNVECLHINHAIINAYCFKQIFKMNRKIECINLRGIILKGIDNFIEDKREKSKLEWDRIGKVLGSKIIHLCIDPRNEHRMNELDLVIFLNHFKILEEFRFGIHFEHDVNGNFIKYLPKSLKLFYSLGIENVKLKLK